MTNIIDKRCVDTVYITPDRILDPVRKFFGGCIPLDAATEPNNPTKADRFYTEEDNGLERFWCMEGTFLNPPYGKVLQEWTKKINLEVHLGVPLVALLPGQRFETAYWQENILVDKLDAIVFIRRRVPFFRPDGTLAKSNPYGSMLYIYNTIGLNVVRTTGNLWIEECFLELGKICFPKFHPSSWNTRR